MTTRRVLCIVNPAAGAGRAKARWTVFAPELRTLDCRVDSLATTRPGDANRIAREKAGDYDLLVAAGGDGTASEVASGILASASPQTPLGLVPIGTANDVAHAMGIRSEGESRCALQGLRTRFLDLIEVRCQAGNQETVHHALLFAAVGIVGDVLRRTTPTVKRIFGRRLAYPVGVLRALWRYQPPEIQVTCDGQSFTNRFLFAAASNTECAGGGMRFAPGARVDDGLLNVNLIQAVSRWKALAEVRRLCRGQHVMHPEVRYFTARSVTIKAVPPADVQVDGDLIGSTPARFDVRPNALRLLVP
jgi:YegS/Rv2252/BmrU family lipid kinase